MKKLLVIPAYLWAVICMLLIPVTFMGNAGFAEKLSRLPFMKIHPVFTGGEVDHTWQDDSLIISVYKPVFPALIGKSRIGFVQIRFSGPNPLPPTVGSSVDLDRDGTPDFSLLVDTSDGKTDLVSYARTDLSLVISSKVKDDWVVRVGLKNPER